MSLGEEQIELSATLRDIVKKVQSEDTPISMRMRLLFLLRSMETSEAAQAVQLCISGSSVLLDHEVAYVLGQMRQECSVDFLVELAKNSAINPIVRHEAIEALGNFGDSGLIERIECFLEAETAIVRESAFLAVRKLRAGVCEAGKFGSHDPASPFCGTFEEALAILRKGDLESKYKAMFFFRNLNTREAVEALSECFSDESALLRHEAAFVLGQMENPYSVDILIACLRNEREEDIVRHEAAEALGNIGTEEALGALREFLSSDIRILRESAEVGLGIAENPDDKYFEVDISA